MIKKISIQGGIRTVRLPASACLQVSNDEFAITIIIIIAIIRPKIGKNLDGQSVFIVFAALTHMSSVRRVAHRYCHCRHCVSCENHKQHVFQAELRSYDGGVYSLNGSEANGWLDDAFSRICAMPMAR